MSARNAPKQRRLLYTSVLPILSPASQWVCGTCQARLALKRASSQAKTTRQRSGASNGINYMTSQTTHEGQTLEIRDTSISARSRREKRPTTYALVRNSQNVSLDLSRGLRHKLKSLKSLVSRRHLSTVERSTLQYLSDLSTRNPGPSRPWDDSIRVIAYDALYDEDARQQAAKVLADMLRKKDLFALLDFLDVHMTDDLLIRTPQTTWSQILSLLDPRNFLLPSHTPQRSLNRNRLLRLGVHGKEKRRELIDKLSDVVRLRRLHGQCMVTSDYRALLQYCAMNGDLDLAKAFWSDMQKDGVRPDILCYNALLRATVWYEKGVIPQLSRTKKRPDHKDVKQSSRIDIMQYMPNITSAVREIWSEMEKSDLKPTTATYCALLIALSRDARFDEINTILFDVFRIDLNAIVQGKAPTRPILNSDAFIRPDTNLLGTIVDVFGILNQVEIALRVVYHVSEAYDITITKEIWHRLLRWGLNQAEHAPKDRQVPMTRPMVLSDISKLGQILRSSPYNITPHVDLLDVLFRSHIFASETGEHAPSGPFAARLEILHLGYKEYLRLVNYSKQVKHRISLHLNQAQDQTQAQSRSQFSSNEPPSLSPPDRPTEIKPALLPKLEMQLKNAEFAKRKVAITLQRWCRKIVHLKNHDYAQIPKNRDVYDAWIWSGLPAFIRQWRWFLPSIVKIHLARGIVELQIKSVASSLPSSLPGPIAKEGELGVDDFSRTAGMDDSTSQVVSEIERTQVALPLILEWDIVKKGIVSQGDEKIDVETEKPRSFWGSLTS